MHTTGLRAPKEQQVTGAMKAQSVRVSNTSLVLKTILRSEEPISRATVASQTGLTRATVSRLVDDLRNLKILEELEPSPSTVGRPSLPLTAKPLSFFTIALELNVNYIAMLVIDLAGNVLHSVMEDGDLRSSDPQRTLRRASRMLQEWTPPRGGKIVATTLVIPGLINQSDNTILVAPNLGWHDVNPSHLMDLPETYGILRVRNEADSAAFASIYSAPGRPGPHDTFLYLSSDVGVGSAIMLDGTLFEGKHFWAGEIGHTCVDPAGPRCTCGANGCLEQYVGQDALLSAANLALDSPINDLIDLFVAGDTVAHRTLDQAGTSLGRAIANALNLIDIDLVILGGNLAHLLPHFEKLLYSEVSYRMLSSRWVETEIIADTHGARAAVLGACYASFEDFVENLQGWA